jgi:hypothetical protein
MKYRAYAYVDLLVYIDRIAYDMKTRRPIQFNNDLGLLLLMLQVGVSASHPEAARILRDVDLSPGQPLQTNHE